MNVIKIHEYTCSNKPTRIARTATELQSCGSTVCHFLWVYFNVLTISKKKLNSLKINKVLVNYLNNCIIYIFLCSLVFPPTRWLLKQKSTKNITVLNNNKTFISLLNVKKIHAWDISWVYKIKQTYSCS